MTKADDLLATLRAVNESAAFNRWAGIAVTQAAPGEAELTLVWRNDLGQYSGFLHAGLNGALIDTVCGFAAYTLAGPVLASSFTVNCLAPAIGERFIARGRVIKAGRRQIFATADLFAEKSGPLSLVATGSALLVPASAP